MTSVIAITIGCDWAGVAALRSRVTSQHSLVKPNLGVAGRVPGGNPELACDFHLRSRWRRAMKRLAAVFVCAVALPFWAGKPAGAQEGTAKPDHDKNNESHKEKCPQFEQD